MDLAEIPEGATVLDIGTGEGSVLIPAAEKTGDHGLGIGIDIDFGGFKHARPGIQKRGLRNTAWAQMDATKLGFMNGLFDRALCGFIGWNYCFDFVRCEFTSPDIILAEISRVLRVGGRVGISSWAMQEDLDWLGDQFRRYLPAYVADRKRDSALTVYSKENAKGLEMVLREGCFQDIEIATETAEFVSTDEEEWWWQVWGAGWQENIDRVAHSDADKFKKFKKQVFDNLQIYKRSDGIHFQKTVLFALGNK